MGSGERVDGAEWKGFGISLWARVGFRDCFVDWLGALLIHVLVFSLIVLSVVSASTARFAQSA